MEANNSIEHLASECACIGKQCTRCQKVQCIEGFHRWKYAQDGRRSICKVCRKAERETEEFKAKRRDYHKEHADQINEKKRAWYHNNPERERQRTRNYREQNPEKVKAQQYEYNRSEKAKQRDKRYRERHPEKAKQTHRNYWFGNHEHNLDQLRVHHARMRTLQTGAGGAFNIAEWEALKARYDYTCLCCGRKEPEITLTVDHVYPVSQQGSSFIDNIQPLCLSCNSRKGTKIIDYRIKEENIG